MTGSDRSAGAGKKSSRGARLAAALRRNLARRKAAGRPPTGENEPLPGDREGKGPPAATPPGAGRRG